MISLDLLAHLNSTKSSVCLFALDYAGLSANMCDIQWPLDNRTARYNGWLDITDGFCTHRRVRYIERPLSMTSFGKSLREAVCFYAFFFSEHQRVKYVVIDNFPSFVKATIFARAELIKGNTELSNKPITFIIYFSKSVICG